jgi:Uma2 family endonuclease
MSMTAAPKLHRVSVEDYLAGELVSEVKHEYLGGYVYAMAGARNVHNRIASNVLGVLHAKLRGQPCQPYNSDTKIRVNLPTHVRFYYPDVSVVCDSNPPDDSYQDQPVVVVEVLSNKTRRIDQGEKKDSYLNLPTLSVYLLVEQDFPAVIAYRRTDQGFIQETYLEREAVVSLAEIGAELQLAEIYEGVEFVPEPENEEP